MCVWFFSFKIRLIFWLLEIKDDNFLAYVLYGYLYVTPIGKNYVTTGTFRWQLSGKPAKLLSITGITEHCH